MTQEKLIIQSLKPYLPKVKEWIDNLLRQNSSLVRPLSSFQFQRLPKYFSQNIIDNTKIIIVNKMPKIPLADMGLSGFGHFENLDVIGVVYLDTIFIKADYQREEWVYFHELIHILQWQAFSYDDFLLAYGLGLYQHQNDYSKSPFEAMAYKNQDIFQKDNVPFDVEWKLKPQIEGYKTFIEGLR